MMESTVEVNFMRVGYYFREQHKRHNLQICIICVEKKSSIRTFSDPQFLFLERDFFF
jgi:hypothetical protein